MRHVAYKTWAQGRLARKNSPSTAPSAALPRKSSPSKRKNADFRVFRARRANFFALTHTSGHAGRTLSRTRHDNMAALKPTTPLLAPEQQPLKPPSPLLAPKQRPLKPPSPLQPKNAPKTPISHPQRRCRFHSRLGRRPQRRWRFQTNGPLGSRVPAAPPAGNNVPTAQKIRMQFPHAHFML